MKRRIRLISSLLLALVIGCGMTLTAYAGGSVTYDGAAQDFIFTPGSEYSPTDLFDGYKGVMPGDVLRDTINVKNDASDDVIVDIYMKSLGATDLTEEDGIATVSQEASAGFLSQLNLVVRQDGSEIFNAPADQTDGLTDWVHLGTFEPGDDVNLNLELEVPIDLNNDYAGAIGALDWVFKVVETPLGDGDEDPDGDDDDKGVETGDYANIMLPVSLAGGSLLLILVLFFVRRRRA